MADIYVKSGSGTPNTGTYRGLWANSTTWAVGDRVAPSLAYATAGARGYIYECTTGGAGGASEPTWVFTTPGTSTTTSGSAVFTCRAPSTWANALIDLSGAAANDAAGDNIYVSQAHAESQSVSLTYNFAGTYASPVKVIGANDSAAPPTSTSTAPTVTTTGNTTLTFTGSGSNSLYLYGLTFSIGTGASGGRIDLTGGFMCHTFESCKFRIATSASQQVVCGTANAWVVMKNCSFRFGAAGQYVYALSPRVEIIGGSLESGGTSPTRMFQASDRGLYVSGFDLTNASAGVHIFLAGNAGNRGYIRNSKLPVSWSGSLADGTLGLGERYEMHNCDSADTNYRMRVQDYAGQINQETVVVRTGGATDGTTPISWKLVSTANAEYPHITLDTPEIVRWNETTGSAITVTVEVITDNVTLTDGECWVEVQYLGTSGFPLGSFINDAKADVLATAANQTTSSVTWTTTGLTTPVKQKLAVTFTPQEKGFLHAVVKLAKASTTVYVCPKLDVT